MDIPISASLERRGQSFGRATRTIHIHLATVAPGTALDALDYADRMASYADRHEDVESAGGTPHADMQAALRAIEGGTRRANGIVGITGVVELSFDLDDVERQRVAEDLASALAGRGHKARAVVHRPDEDARTWHIHLIATARPVRPTISGWFAEPEGTRGRAGPQPLLGTKSGLQRWRRIAANLQNQLLQHKDDVELVAGDRLRTIGIEREGLLRIPEAVLHGNKTPDAFASYVLAHNAAVIAGQDPREDEATQSAYAELRRRQEEREVSRAQSKAEARKLRLEKRRRAGWLRPADVQDLIEQERERDHQPSAAVVDAEEREVLSARQRGFAEDVYGRSKGECLEEGWWRDEHRASAVWAEVRRAYEIERSRRLELEDRLGLEPHVLIENWENASRALEAFDQATLEEARNACGEPAIEEKAASRFFEEERARLEQLVAKDRSEAVRKRARQFGLLRHGVLGGFDDSSGRLWAYEQADALEQAHDRQIQRKAAAKATLEAYQRLESAEEVAREAILKSHEARKLAMEARIPVPGLPIGDIDGESLDEIVHKLSKQTSVTGYSAAMRAIGVIYNHLRRDLPTDSRSMRRAKRKKKKDDLQH